MFYFMFIIILIYLYENIIFIVIFFLCSIMIEEFKDGRSSVILFFVL